jgi:hypothetical protein
MEFPQQPHVAIHLFLGSFLRHSHQNSRRELREIRHFADRLQSGRSWETLLPMPAGVALSATVQAELRFVPGHLSRRKGFPQIPTGTHIATVNARWVSGLAGKPAGAVTHEATLTGANIPR